METKVLAEISKCVRIEGTNETYTVRGNVNISGEKVVSVESGEVIDKDGNVAAFFSQYENNSSVNFNGVSSLEQKNEIISTIADFADSSLCTTTAE